MARRKASSKKEQTGVARWNASEGGPSYDRKTVTEAHKRTHKRMRADKRRYLFTLLVLVVGLVVCVVGFMPPQDRVTQGLDIRGGVSVIMTASKQDGSTPTSDEMSTATQIVQQRVNSLGASETSVQQQGATSILVQIPGATNADDAVKTIGQTGHLEFVNLDDIGDADALAQLNAGTEDVKLKEGTYTAFLDGSHISQTSVAQSSTSSKGEYSVNLTLDSEGANKFAEVTKELAPTKGRIAIVLDGVVKSAPAVQSEITGGQVSITGNFTLDDAKSLKTVLDSGSLPVTLTYSESRVVGPTLGQDALTQGLTALAVGVAIVVIYLFVFYHGLGLLTLGSLAVFGVLYLGLLALLSHFGLYSLTLPGLAGMVLTTGSAADSSILVLERFREEIRMGKTIKNASVSGSKHGIKTSLDADVVTLVTALCLFFVAVGAVKGFGLTLALGVACDIVTMFCFKAPALCLLALHIIQKHPGFWGVKQDLEEAQRRAQKKESAAQDAAVLMGGEARA